MFKKFKNFANEKTEKVIGFLAPVVTIGTTMGLIMPTVYADKAGEAISAIVDIVFKIFKYIGVILALWGVGSLVMAFKNEDADSKSRAIMSLVVGICLVALDTLFGGFIDSLLV